MSAQEVHQDQDAGIVKAPDRARSGPGSATLLAIGYQAFTAENWPADPNTSMDKVYCRRRSARTAGIVSGLNLSEPLR